MKRLTSVSFSFWMLVCVRNAGRQECNTRDRLKIRKKFKGEKEAGKWREKRKNKYNYEKMEKVVEHNEN